MDKKIAEVVSIVRNRILGIPEVTSIGYDEETGEIVVTVESEEVKAEVEEALPSVIAGYEIRIEVMRRPGFLWNRKAQYRPIPGGVSACHHSGTACTNATRVFDDDGNVRLLSNVHCYTSRVFTEEYGERGEAVEQPSPADQPFGEGDFKIGEQHRWVPYRTKEPNYVDAALAKPTVGVSDYILGENRERWVVTEPVAPKKGMLVKKSGRTSGVTHCKITHTHQDIKVESGKMGTLIFADQIIFKNIEDEPPILGGDSGSALLSENGNKMVGLCFAGDGKETGIANPVGYVMALLDIGFSYPHHAPPEFPEEKPPTPIRDVVFLASLPLVGIGISRWTHQ